MSDGLLAAVLAGLVCAQRSSAARESVLASFLLTHARVRATAALRRPGPSAAAQHAPLHLSLPFSKHSLPQLCPTRLVMAGEMTEKIICLG